MASFDESPDWLGHVLRDCVGRGNAETPRAAADGFAGRCRDAAIAAQDVLRIRRVIAGAPAAAEPLVPWLLDAASRADVPSSRLLSAFQISEDGLDAGSAAGWGRLCQRLGLRIEDALRSFRQCVILALRGSGEPMADWSLLPLRARRDSYGGRGPEDGVAAGHERELTDDQRRQLLEFVSTFREAYQDISRSS